MPYSKKRLSVIFTALLLAGGVSGCAQHQPVLSQQPLTCREALATSTGETSNKELVHFLAESVGADQQGECWRPLMKKMLDERQDIPLDHLKKAVKAFNHQQDQEIFHKAIYRYLAEIAKGNAPYRPADRMLLESYASYTIQNAAISDDKNLEQARILCQRLDRNLYSKFFE